MLASRRARTIRLMTTDDMPRLFGNTSGDLTAIEHRR